MSLIKQQLLQIEFGKTYYRSIIFYQLTSKLVFNGIIIIIIIIFGNVRLMMIISISYTIYLFVM